MSILSKRATIYFDPEIYKAIRLRSIHSEQSISEIINEFVKQALREDMEDLMAFEETKKEPEISFEDVLKDLEKRGKL